MLIIYVVNWVSLKMVSEYSNEKNKTAWELN